MEKNFPIFFQKYCRFNKVYFMYKDVILESFKKGGNEISGKTTKSQIAEHISIYLLNEYKIQVSGRTLRNLFNDACTINENKDISVNSSFVNALCNYLGYKNYNHFIKDNPDPIRSKLISNIKKKWIIILISLITISSVIGFGNFNQERWMQWDGYKYIEVKFNKEKYELDQIELLNKKVINSFHKITPNCKTSFFDEKGIEKLWYGKNPNKDVEFFSSLGRHPETGKTLKPITRYMIKKYICDSY